MREQLRGLGCLLLALLVGAIAMYFSMLLVYQEGLRR